MSAASATVRQKLRELAALPPGAPVPSPCNAVCRIGEANGVCEGCFRTLDEIAAWGGLDDGGRREVWRRLALRAGIGTAREQR